jgi:hypothetical protein
MSPGAAYVAGMTVMVRVSLFQAAIDRARDGDGCVGDLGGEKSCWLLGPWREISMS